jgi:hypothetical protein
MIAEVIRGSMNVAEFVTIVGVAFALGAFLGLWISR